MKLLPLMVGWFALNLPSGLGLYYLSNTVLTTGQQVFLRKLGGAVQSGRSLRKTLKHQSLAWAQLLLARLHPPPQSTRAHWKSAYRAWPFFSTPCTKRTLPLTRHDAVPCKAASTFCDKFSHAVSGAADKDFNLGPINVGQARHTGAVAGPVQPFKVPKTEISHPPAKHVLGLCLLSLSWLCGMRRPQLCGQQLCCVRPSKLLKVPPERTPAAQETST